jgi:chorismate synthase
MPASNAFGTLFRIMTWGESHGPAIGVVIDGCPAGLLLSEEEINIELKKRAPGIQPHTSPRKEPDLARILSGLFEGKTTGAPISIMIANCDADSSRYESIKEILRPGHANFTYLQKYAIFDYRGGGRSSARETACRVAAGAVAKKLLAHYEIELFAFLNQIGDATNPDEMIAALERAQKEGDSLGGNVGFRAENLPAGLGDPIYEKIEAKLAHAMLSLPASKAFEIGMGFQAAAMKGSEHNDRFITAQKSASNSAGGTLAGITTGMPLYGSVAFKPASSIQKEQESVDIHGQPCIFRLPERSRHDPCVAIRAVPVVEAMLALVLADSLLMNRCSRL